MVLRQSESNLRNRSSGINGHYYAKDGLYYQYKNSLK